MIAHCFFEQSGTFKNEFRKLGYEAYDYDILNDYGQTDYQIDLFAEIKKAYKGGQSIFDKISPEDLILAFFPCTRFEAIIPLAFRGEQLQQKDWDDIKKLTYSMKLQEELTELYMLLSMMCIVCIRKGLRMMIENPYTQPHYLTTYWCLKPTIIDKDRRENGDYYKKPTQYWFIGFKPANNLVMEVMDHVDTKCIDREKGSGEDRKARRSLIHPQYASRFIRQFLI
ncbi:MAG: hypothetical protein IKN47_07865 [Lachnospiraceae bacterium]|nr:hypothetical protein [Lachnospiraceae bacterium]